MALKYLMQIFNIKKIEELLYIITNNCIPLYKTNYNKGLYLGFMVRNLLEVIIGYKKPSDRDSMLYKRISSSGAELSTLFREWYISLKLNIETKMKQLYKNVNLNREVIFTKLDYEKLLDKGGNKNIIWDGIMKGFKGNWGVKSFAKKITIDNIHDKINVNKYTHSKDGIVQEMNKINYLTKIFHLREVKTPMDANIKLIGPRKLHATQYGYLCPIDSPDGANCGIIKTMSMGCTISIYKITIKRIKFIELLQLSKNFILIDKIILENNNNYYYVFFRGEFIGLYCNINNSIIKFYNILKLLKRNGIINNDISIYINYDNKEINISDEQGRCLRPLYVIYNKQIVRNKYNIKLSLSELIKKENKFNINNIPSNIFTDEELLKQLEDNQSPIELVDTDESYYSLIAMNETILNNNIENDYNYLEIHPQLIISINAGLIPFTNHNPAPRNVYVCQQFKAAIGVPSTCLTKRMDTVNYLLKYPQKPIVGTMMNKLINYDDMPTGMNITIAILTYTGFNQEDSVIINRNSIERGLYNMYYYRTYEETLEQNKNEIFINPDLQYRKNDADYSKINTDGSIDKYKYINDNDIIIGKLTKLHNSELEYRDTSITIHHGDEGVIDNTIADINYFNNTFMKVKMMMERLPIVGDKFGSRHAQKGVVGRIIEYIDMPYTKDGIVPDIILNPHCIPSRMTIGQLIEVVGASIGINLGMFLEANAFSDIDISLLSDILESPPNNMHRHSNNILYNGITGEQLQSDIFIGPCYYQRFKHMVSDKFQARDRGAYNNLNKQPVSGRSRGGGMRLGEMECWSLIANGLSEFIKESWMERSDQYIIYTCKKTGLMIPYNDELKYNPENKYVNKLHIPYATKLFLQELEGMNIFVRLFIN